MQSQQDLNATNDKKIQKVQKSFSNRTPIGSVAPFSSEYSRAKQKAYERYKKIYPLEDK